MTQEERLKAIREECEDEGETLTGVLVGSAEVILKRSDVLWLLDLVDKQARAIGTAVKNFEAQAEVWKNDKELGPNHWLVAETRAMIQRIQEILK